jgi:hypothetical protein
MSINYGKGYYHFLLGTRFGALTVERETHRAGWLETKCDCGEYREVQAARLMRGELKACVRCKVWQKMHNSDYSIN